MLEKDFSTKEIKPATIQELAQSYKVSLHVFRKWIRPHRHEIGRRNGQFYTPKQIQIIYKVLNPPD